jgi:hypothetical protein
MKNQTIKTVLALAFLAAANARFATANAQGSLTPPAGAPAPVMKSLDQIEARTPVNTLSGDASASYVIASPGSYYLTGPLAGQPAKCGIRVLADNVTLDLNGFTLEAAAGSLAGIQIDASSGQVTIRNGVLRSWPKGGIISTQAVNCQVENVAIRSVNGPGIQVAGVSAVRRVQVNGASGVGISALGGVVSDSTVENVNFAQAGTTVYGIYAEVGSVLNCNVRGVTGNGPLAVGIGTGIAKDCSVDYVSNPSGGAAGLHAIVLQTNKSSVVTGSAENCRARNISCSGMANGITYFGTVRGCSASEITTTSSNGSAYGVNAPQVIDSSVINVKGPGNFIHGIAGLNINNCQVQNISNSSTNNHPAIGILLDDGFGYYQGGVARGCFVRNVDNYGIYATTGCLVSQCSVFDASVGFYAYGSGNVFDSNAASGCSTGFGLGSSNLAKGNASSDNSVYDFSPGTVVVQSQSGATNIFSNFSW